MAQTHTTTMTHGTITVETSGFGGNGTPGAKGSRNNAILQAAFPGSPIYTPNTDKTTPFSYASATALKDSFINNVIHGNIDDGQFGLSGYNLDFQQDGAEASPNLTTQALTVTTTDGRPANGFTPNPYSPGEGSLDASTKPEVAADSALATRLADITTADGKAAFAGDGIVSRADLSAQALAIVNRNTDSNGTQITAPASA